MKKIFGVIGIILVIVAFSLSTLTLAFANDEELGGIELGKQLVDSKASCDTLSTDQLEAVGDYIMEQMHPGGQHEVMENMMGGDGSETVKSAHITMAQHMYCGNYSYGKDSGNLGGCGMMGNKGMMSGSGMMGSRGMMGNMMNMMSGGMMGGYSGYGMMGNNYQNLGGNNMAYGMMGGYGGYGTTGYGSGMMSSGMFWLNGFLAFLLLIGLVVLVWLWVFKSWNELTKKGKK
ncbi:hypothetical protein HYU06_00160 [Candidatus Woesearchaeota archaeon]|nr:hypothetical protein [Candidatus Woesearchaeota archaeon]